MAQASLGERIPRFVPRPASPLQAGLAVGAATILIAILAIASAHSKGGARVAPAGAPATSAVTPAGIAQLSSSLGQPIYWVGPRSRVTYELTRTGTQILLRYLPPGVQVGDSRPFLTVGTYQFQNAFASTQALTRQAGVVGRKIRAGGIAVYRQSRPTNVYVAYPFLAYQIEVFSPHAAQALSLATGGALTPVPVSVAPALKPGTPTRITPGDLRALSTSLGQRVYWLGPRPATTYELTQKGSQLFLRYLPRGVPVGSPQPELTVGTYRVPNAYQVTSGAATRPDAHQVDVGPNAVAFYRPSRPQSVYLSFRGQDLQLEVYDPDSAAALRLATSGQLRPVR